jgi:hypothetical protein
MTLWAHDNIKQRMITIVGLSKAGCLCTLDLLFIMKGCCFEHVLNQTSIMRTCKAYGKICLFGKLFYEYGCYVYHIPIFLHNRLVIVDRLEKNTMMYKTSAIRNIAITRTIYYQHVEQPFYGAKTSRSCCMKADAIHRRFKKSNGWQQVHSMF